MTRRKKETEAPSEAQVEIIVGVLVSRVDEPVLTTYDGKGVRVSPRAKLRGVEQSKLEYPLPKGLIFVRNK